MNQADKDAQKWIEHHAKWEARRLVEAKESGDPHYINKNGDVVIEKEKDES